MQSKDTHTVFDFNKPILQLDGSPYKDPEGNDMLMNVVLANNLITCTSFSDYVKIMEWARTAHATGIIKLDVSDTNSLKGIIRGIQNMFPIVKEQLMKVFDEAVK